MPEKSRPQRLWQYLTTRSNWTKISALSTIIATIALRVAGRFGIGGMTDSQVLFGIVIALGLLISTLLVEQPDQLSRIHDEIGQVSRGVDDALALVRQPPELSGFFKDRDAITSYAGGYARRARQEIFAIGVTLAHYALHEKDFVEDKARSGCQVRFLLPSPKQDGQPAPLVAVMESHFAEPNYGRMLETSIASLRDLQTRLQKAPGNGVQLRLYTTALPTLGVTIVDASLPTGKMLVELYPYRCSPRKRPSFELKRREDQGLFDLLCKNYEMLWRDSAPA